MISSIRMGRLRPVARPGDRMSISEFIALLALAIWLFMLAGWGRFWLASVRDDDPIAPSRESPSWSGPSSHGSPSQLSYSQTSWPSVAVVIPARNEAEGIGETIRSLLA